MRLVSYQGKIETTPRIEFKDNIDIPKGEIYINNEDYVFIIPDIIKDSGIKIVYGSEHSDPITWVIDEMPSTLPNKLKPVLECIKDINQRLIREELKVGGMDLMKVSNLSSMQHTEKVNRFLEDYFNLLSDRIEEGKIEETENYIEILSDIIEENITVGDNLLMTQSECLEFYKSECEHILKIIPQLEEKGASKDYIEGFKYAIELFRLRDEF